MTAGTSHEVAADLPYGPLVAGSLPILGRAFRFLNRFYVIPAIKAGLAPLHSNPLTGSWMLLRTTGRRTGRPREVALGYAILDGRRLLRGGVRTWHPVVPEPARGVACGDDPARRRVCWGG